MKTAIKTLSLAVLAILVTMPVSHSANADATISSSLVVKTSVAEVIGVREIESGRFDSGIRKSKAGLSKTSTASLRRPLLDNLCVAHLAINDMAQANKYCHAAVNTGKGSAISYNNRAVMHYVSGNLAASLEDLDAASNFGHFQNMVQGNMRIVNQQNILSKN